MNFIQLQVAIVPYTNEVFKILDWTVAIYYINFILHIIVSTPWLKVLCVSWSIHYYHVQKKPKASLPWLRDGRGARVDYATC